MNGGAGDNRDRTRIRIASFDLDGTLADTGAEIAEAANRALHALDLCERDTAAIVRHVGHGGRELMRRLLIDAGEATSSADLDAAHASFDAAYAEIAGTRSVPFPGCVEALGRIADAGIAIACTTNKNEAFARSVLAACGIAERFALVVGGDTLPFSKPDGRVLGHVVSTLGGAVASTVHIGDSRTDVEAARAAGVAAWAVSWGYNGGEPIESAHPDREFASFEALAAAILRARRGRS